MYRFVFLLCFFSRTILCTPNMEILPNSKSSEVCEDFIILGGNFESVTFKVTGNDSTFVINRYSGPNLLFAADDGQACPLISFYNDCRSIVWDQYTCTCEQKGPEEFHLTFNNTPNATREPFTLYMKWDGLNAVTKLSNNFTLKGVKGRRDCWTPTMTILNTKTSSYCSNDNLVMNIDYQLIKFNISWSNSEYVLDRTGTPTVVDSSTEEDLCPLIDQNNDCSFRMFGGYSCLCNKITPDEYHLTFNYTPTQANRSLTLYMKWVGKNGASVIKSDKYTFKEATGTPNMEILPNSKSSEVCEDFIILGGNFESVTFKVTGNDSTFLINRYNGPKLYFAADDGQACPLISFYNDCRSIVWDQYTCTCEQKGPEEFHLTFNNTPNATREPFTLYMKWDGLNAVTKLSNNFTLKGVKGRRDCWTPTMTILNTKTSSYCSNDNLVMNIDYQLIKFNISWSNSEYVLDRTGTPTVVDSSTEEDLCPLIDQNNDCSFRMFGGYSCLCNKITPDEYHLTFNYTPTQANRSLTLYMKWVGKNGASVIKSDKYTFKEATAPEPKADPEDELPQREENILRTSSSVVDP